MMEPVNTSGMRTFLIIQVGQVISVLGSGLTGFAIGIWVYQRTGSVTQFALSIFAMALPSLLIAPFAGILVDRWDRRFVMIAANIGSATSILLIALLFYSGHLRVWYVYILLASLSICGWFHMLAYNASVSMLVSKEQYGRASGVNQTGAAFAQIIAPALASFMLELIRLEDILLLDFASFFVAIVSLLMVKIPKPQNASHPGATRGPFFREALEGWKYVIERSGLIWLVIFASTFHFLISLSNALMLPLLMGFATVKTLGMIGSISSVGTLVGGLFMSLTGGPKRRIYGVIAAQAIVGLSFMLAGLQPSVTLIAISSFFISLSFPIMMACNHAIWLSKIPPGIQGRVFSARMTMPVISVGFAYLIAGPLADKVFTPLLAEGGMLSGSVGQIIGVGPGRGIALLLIVLGTVAMASTASGYLNPRLRLIETQLPDAITQSPPPDQHEEGVATARAAPSD